MLGAALAWRGLNHASISSRISGSRHERKHSRCEYPHHRLGAALGRPHDLAGELVADGAQVGLALLVRDLSMAMATRPSSRSTRPSASVATRTQAVDCQAREAIALGGRRLVRDDGVVHDQVLEGPGEGGVVTGPGTSATVGPWTGQLTRGASASSSQVAKATST